MFNDPVLAGMSAFAMVFLFTWGVGFFLFLRAYGDRRRAISRLRDLSAENGPAAEERVSPEKRLVEDLPLIGSLFLPKEESRLDHMKALLMKAGIYHGHAPHKFVAAKWLLMLVLPVLFAGIPFLARWLPLNRVPLVAVSACAFGMWAPHLWLRSQIKKRQAALRSALPDTLDMLVLCLEGGVSLMAAIQRVTDELQVVHPELGGELNIMQREIQLGLSPGEALKELSRRCGLEEVRDLAATILQSEQYGASVAKTFRTYADSYRQERQQRAEEMAQKAAVKILFPTLLFIFPAIFIVLLGPAAFQIATMFSR